MGDDQNPEGEIERKNEDYDISPVILASALANLSSTESAMGGDRHRAMARVDSARERHSASGVFLVNSLSPASLLPGVVDQLLTRKTPEAEWSWPYNLK